MDSVLNWLSIYGGKVALTILVAGIFYYVGAMFMGSAVKRTLTATRHNWNAKDIEKRHNTLTGLFKTMWRVLIITLAALIIMWQLFPDVSLAPLFASAGIIGVALGFGAQSLVQDFISGLFIISENQYRVGDIVDIEGFSGTVERIGARSTVIRDADGNVHYFPNGMIQHVINKTMGYSMARFFVTLHPATDVDDVAILINEIGEKLTSEKKWAKKIIEAPAFVSITEFTSAGVTLLIAGKTQPSDQWAVTAEMRRRLLAEFEERKIELGTAYPAMPAPTAARRK